MTSHLSRSLSPPSVIDFKKKLIVGKNCIFASVPRGCGVAVFGPLVAARSTDEVGVCVGADGQDDTYTSLLVVYTL